ncbi:hypothetical protein V2J09_012382 [Rumex salicifolius]
MENPTQQWTAEEEEALRAGIVKYGTGKWYFIQRDPEINQQLYSYSNIDLQKIQPNGSSWGCHNSLSSHEAIGDHCQGKKAGKYKNGKCQNTREEDKEEGSDKQLYAMLVDDQNKKCLFYASTIQKGIRSDPEITTEEAAEAVGEELVKAAADLNINEVSSYDLNGSAVRGFRGQRIRAFESATRSYGFLP